MLPEVSPNVSGLTGATKTTEIHIYPKQTGIATKVFDLLPLCTQSLANTTISCNKTFLQAHSHLDFSPPLSRKDDSMLVIQMKME